MGEESTRTPGGAEKTLSRRELLEDLKTGVLAAAGAAGAAVLAARSAAAAEGPQDALERMRLDLQRALVKPAAERRWAMAIDLRKCIGCKACTVACMAENKLPPGVVYRPVLEETQGKFPDVRRKFTPRPCMHCEKPACLEACPEGAIKRRPDGIVFIDYGECKGVQACVASCPYGVPLFDGGQNYTDKTPALQPYEKAPGFEMGKRRLRDKSAHSPVGKARKCTYCFHRLEAGMLPACASTCVGRATYFGDLKDSWSLVSELAKSPRAARLNEAAGTKPTTFYLT